MNRVNMILSLCYLISMAFVQAIAVTITDVIISVDNESKEISHYGFDVHFDDRELAYQCVQYDTTAVSYNLPCLSVRRGERREMKDLIRKCNKRIFASQ